MLGSSARIWQAESGALMARSILAVIGGYAVTVVCVVALDFGFGALVPGGRGSPSSPPTSLMVLNVAFGIPCAVLGGYVCALIARRAEVMHALVLGIVAEAMSIASLILQLGSQPLWYGLALVLIVLPSMLAGGYLRANRLHASKE